MKSLSELEFNALVKDVQGVEVKGLGKGVSNSGKMYGTNRVVYKQWVLPNGDVAEHGVIRGWMPFFYVFSKEELKELSEMPRNIARETGTISSKGNPIF